MYPGKTHRAVVPMLCFSVRNPGGGCCFRKLVFAGDNVMTSLVEVFPSISYRKVACFKTTCLHMLLLSVPVLPFFYFHHIAECSALVMFRGLTGLGRRRNINTSCLHVAFFDQPTISRTNGFLSYTVIF